VLVRHHDSPFTDTSAYPTYYAGKLAREFTDVILTGDGPDQTMAGSAHHVFALKNELFKNRRVIPAWLYRSLANAMGLLSESPVPSLISRARRNLYRKSLSGVQAAYELRSYCPALVKESLCNKELRDMHYRNNPFRHPESWFKQAEAMDDTNKYLFADIQFYVTDDLMIKVDRMCMAHGLETLSPFQDRELGKCVLRMPGDFKLHVGPDGSVVTKYILKRVCEKRFPALILNKKKQGFGIPLEKWLRDDCADSVREVLLDERTLNRGYFKKESLRRMVNDFLEGRSDYYYANPYLITALLTLEIWHREYLD
jgi:asparagine synthase (glutamine-hydrolysing)